MCHGWFEGVSQYRCLFSSVCMCSPACDPGDGPSEGSTEINGGIVDREPVDLGPEFEMESDSDEPAGKADVRVYAARRVYRWCRPPRYGIETTSPR